MALDTRNGSKRLPSVGIDAVSLARYSDVETDNDEMIVYDEEAEDAWIQSNQWCAATEIV